ncbi:MAG: DUF4394 domain-containing protein [Roseinatronobacter sp.]
MKTLALSTTLLTALAASAFAAPAFATTAVGLAGDRTLVKINLDTAEVIGMQEVAYDGRLLGIDYRPATNTIIAVTDTFDVVTIDPVTGEWSLITTMSAGMDIAQDAAVIVDINPVPDALRFMSGTTNHRINLTTGEAMVDGDLHFADATDGTPVIGGTAYSNSFGSPESTQMFNIDTERAALLQQTAPNAGANEMRAEIGVSFEGPIAFDIVTDADGTNTGWIFANGMMHTISLDDGSILESWEIAALDVSLRDLTVFTTPLEALGQ